MSIPPIVVLTSTYYAWLEESFPAIATAQFHDFFNQDILPLTWRQLKLVFNYDPKGLIKYIGYKDASEYYPTLVELMCIWHATEGHSSETTYSYYLGYREMHHQELTEAFEILIAKASSSQMKFDTSKLFSTQPPAYRKHSNIGT